MTPANDLLQKLANLLIKEMQEQLTAAGHVMTSNLVNSLESRITEKLTGATIEILMNSYGLALNDGVPPERIPFTEPSGRGGRSAYIEGLQRFAQLKLGITDNRESLGVAFAIARKQKEKGMPIAGPTKFIEKTLTATESDLEKFVEDWVEQVWNNEIDLLILKLRA
jgi:hypothetical protein